jgi:hypothetical protein
MPSTSRPKAPARLIDEKIKELRDWRGETLARLRQLIKAADPEVVEQVKWRKPSNPGGVPVWWDDGIICTGETYQDKVKLTFDKGAKLKDPARLFNSSLDGNTRRAIDLREGDKLNERAFKTLVRAAAALNESFLPKPKKSKAKKPAGKAKRSTATKKKASTAKKKASTVKRKRSTATKRKRR